MVSSTSKNDIIETEREVEVDIIDNVKAAIIQQQEEALERPIQRINLKSLSRPLLSADGEDYESSSDDDADGENFEFQENEDSLDDFLATSEIMDMDAIRQMQKALHLNNSAAAMAFAGTKDSQLERDDERDYQMESTFQALMQIREMAGDSDRKTRHLLAERVALAFHLFEDDEEDPVNADLPLHHEEQGKETS